MPAAASRSTGILSGLDDASYKKRRRRGDPRRPAAGERRPARSRPAAPEDRHRLRLHGAVLGRAGRSTRRRSRSAAASSGTTATASRTRILRIYNRLIFDELEASGAQLPFDLTRAARRLLGGASELVLPLEQALPAASFRHPTVPESVLPLRPAGAADGSRRLGPEAALLLRRARASRSTSRPADLAAVPARAARPHAPHAQGRVRARDRDGRRQLLEGRGARHVRLEGRQALPGHDARAPLAGAR